MLQQTIIMVTTEDDRSCEYAVVDLTDSAASNCNPDANQDNGTCEYRQLTHLQFRNMVLKALLLETAQHGMD